MDYKLIANIIEIILSKIVCSPSQYKKESKANLHRAYIWTESVVILNYYTNIPRSIIIGWKVLKESLADPIWNPYGSNFE